MHPSVPAFLKRLVVKLPNTCEDFEFIHQIHSSCIVTKTPFLPQISTLIKSSSWRCHAEMSTSLSKWRLSSRAVEVRPASEDVPRTSAAEIIRVKVVLLLDTVVVDTVVLDTVVLPWRPTLTLSKDKSKVCEPSRVKLPAPSSDCLLETALPSSQWATSDPVPVVSHRSSCNRSPIKY